VGIPADGGEAGPDDDTAPLPVILSDRPPPAQAPPSSSSPAGDRVRGPFEPVERPVQQPAPPPAAAQAPSPSAAKMNQIKDLYLTAEAIGDDALARHFEVVSERQRQLIREYFDQAVAGQAEGKSSS